eukprot:CAMPEP_0172927848 /NCGR_PEP_ID=MMETSP1075-20121228/217679_1 /TAXON_ID=2916 /ORGANISM="Ceratium fusus, Strain PA161109" /LENGTH=82 /DNA_ID=CAMNT_0013789125 /DNA_START=431 /DNA_END=679 /DNA_ORIENTATION=+
MPEVGGKLGSTSASQRTFIAMEVQRCRCHSPSWHSAAHPCTVLRRLTQDARGWRKTREYICLAADFHCDGSPTLQMSLALLA